MFRFAFLLSVFCSVCLFPQTLWSSEDSPLVAASQGLSADIQTRESQPRTTLTINNDTLKEMADRGRIAAVAGATETPPTTGADARTHSERHPRREYWRKKHAAAVTAIRKVKDKIADAEENLEALQAVGAQAMTLSQRIRHDGRMEAQRRTIDALRHDLSSANQLFDSAMRQARHEGAIPGWFRGLPRP